MFISHLNIPAPLVLIEVIRDLPEQEVTVNDRFLVSTRAAAVGFAGLNKASAREQWVGAMEGSAEGKGCSNE